MFFEPSWGARLPRQHRRFRYVSTSYTHTLSHIHACIHTYIHTCIHTYIHARLLRLLKGQQSGISRHAQYIRIRYIHVCVFVCVCVSEGDTFSGCKANCGKRVLVGISFQNYFIYFEKNSVEAGLLTRSLRDLFLSSRYLVWTW
jgi:hypothetical protein